MVSSAWSAAARTSFGAGMRCRSSIRLCTTQLSRAPLCTRKTWPALLSQSFRLPGSAGRRWTSSYVRDCPASWNEVWLRTGVTWPLVGLVDSFTTLPSIDLLHLDGEPSRRHAFLSAALSGSVPSSRYPAHFRPSGALQLSEIVRSTSE